MFYSSLRARKFTFIYLILLNQSTHTHTYILFISMMEFQTKIFKLNCIHPCHKYIFCHVTFIEIAIFINFRHFSNISIIPFAIFIISFDFFFSSSQTVSLYTFSRMLQRFFVCFKIGFLETIIEVAIKMCLNLVVIQSMTSPVYSSPFSNHYNIPERNDLRHWFITIYSGNFKLKSESKSKLLFVEITQKYWTINRYRNKDHQTANTPPEHVKETNNDSIEMNQNLLRTMNKEQTNYKKII